MAINVDNKTLNLPNVQNCSWFTEYLYNFQFLSFIPLEEGG